MGLNPKSRVRIESDGTPRGTRVLVDGLVVNTVTKVAWAIDVEQELATCTLELVGVDVAVEGEVTTVDGFISPEHVRRAELAEHGVEHLDLKGDAG